MEHSSEGGGVGNWGLKTSAPPPSTGDQEIGSVRRGTYTPPREAGLCSGPRAARSAGPPAPTKPPEEDVNGCQSQSPGLAGPGGRAAPTMCRQAGCGASAGAPLPPPPGVLRAPLAAHQGPRRVRKQPGSVSGAPVALGLGAGALDAAAGASVALPSPCSGLSLSSCQWALGCRCLPAAKGGPWRQS